MFTQRLDNEKGWGSSLIGQGGITEAEGGDDGSSITTDGVEHWAVNMWMDNCRNIRSGLATQTTRLRVDIGACGGCVALGECHARLSRGVSAGAVRVERVQMAPRVCAHRRGVEGVRTT